MTRFGLDAAEQAGADAVRAVVAAQAPAGDAPLTRDALQALFRALAPTGYLGSTLSRADGGLGLSPLAFAAQVEALAPELTLLGNHSVQRYLAEFGTPAQKQRWLPSLLDGSGIGAIAITEPQAGSDLAGLQTVATREGDTFRVNGRKTWVTHGPVASLIVVLARSGADGRGFTRLLVPAETPGLQVRRLPALGLSHMSFGELTFEDCIVPADAVLGIEGEGAVGSKSAFPIARAMAALQSLRIARAALDAAAGYARGRNILGAPLARRELVQDGFARLEVQVDGLRLHVYRSLENLGRAETLRDLSAAKAAAADLALDACRWSADVLGSTALDPAHPLHRWARDARMMAVVDGTSTLNRLVAGRRHLGER